MKRRHLSVFVFLVVATGLLLAGGATAKTPCDAADKLFKLQLYDAAQTNYTDLLNKDPTLTCAQNGSLEVQRTQAIKSYELGQAYENASQVDLARNAYIEALKKNQTFTKAQDALARIALPRISDPFAEVRTLANLGYYTEAKERLKKTIDENPGIEVPKDLEYLPGENIRFWGGIRSWIEIWGQPLGEFVIFMMVLYALFFRIFPWIYGFCIPRLDIQDFNKGATELDIDKGMATMVEESLIQLSKGEERAQVDMVSGSVKTEIPADVKSVSTQIKILSNFIEWLLPPNVITLSGCLEKPGDRGAGLTLSMINSRTGAIIDNITIWEKDYNPTMMQSEEKEKDPTPYYSLVESAAIWTLFKLHTFSRAGILCRIFNKICAFFQLFTSSELRKKIFNKIRYKIEQGIFFDEDETCRTDNFKIVGTRDWQSYAYFRAGVRWHRQINKDKARQLYLRSLNRDMKNYGALFNLSSLHIEDEDYNQALEKLEMVIGATKPKVNDRFPKEQVWYQAMYKEASTYLYICKLFKSNLFKADNEADKLLLDIVETTKAIQKKDSMALKCNMFKVREDASKLVETIEKAIDAIPKKEVGSVKSSMFEAIGLAKKLAEAIKEAINAMRKNDDKAFEHSMSESDRLAKKLAETIKKEKNKDLAFKFGASEAETLAKTLVDTIAVGLSMAKDKELKKFLDWISPAAVIMYAGTLVYQRKLEDAESQIKSIEPYEKLHYRSRYDLSCYFSDAGEVNEERREEYYQDSLNHLKSALELGGRGFVQWAQKDPSLRGVREFEKTADDFAKIIRKYATQDSLPLEGLVSVGKTHTAKLKEQGVISHRDLILLADNHQARMALAEKLGITVQLLQRWAFLADLMRIVENTQYVNLLEEADIGSLDALKKVTDPCELANLMNQINKAKSLVLQTPSSELIQQWVLKANETESKVK